MQQNEDQTPYHGELNEAGQPSMRSILAEMDAKKRLGRQAQLSGVDRHLVVEAAKNGQDVNTGEPLQPGQTPPPLEGTHPATHQEQAEIAQPYQTEREEMARAEAEQNNPNEMNWIEKSVQNQINAGNVLAEGVRNGIDAIGNAYDSAQQAYNDYWGKPKIPGQDRSSSSEADAVWDEIRNRAQQGQSRSSPVPISQSEFATLVEDRLTRAHGMQIENAPIEDIPPILSGDFSDTEFFGDDYRDRKYVVEGHPSENGSGVPGSYINYMGVGMNMAAAGIPRELLGSAVAAHNGLDILGGKSVRYNIKQIPGAIYWTKFGYDAYKKRYGGVGSDD